MVFRLILFLFYSLLVFSSCEGQPGHQQSGQAPGILSLPGISIGEVVKDLGKNISCIFQDRKKNYWFASNSDGVFRYDGKKITRFTDRHGLCSNFIWSVQEDANGILWFSSRDGICSFDGITFRDYTKQVRDAPKTPFSITKKNLYFGHRDGMCCYDGKNFLGFDIHPENYKPGAYDQNRPYSIYSTLTDKAGNLWLGTQERGVCRLDGKSITWFTEEGLDKAAVRTLYQDRSGTIWAGNNGAGLFRFNGKSFENLTKEMGLENPDFLRKLKAKEGTLARPWTMNEDSEGNLWIGTIDAGVWKWDGKKLRNYTAKDGLASNSVWSIFRNSDGELWFVCGGESIQTLREGRFSKEKIP